jgi:RNA polymerase sigma-70 factor (ECF subfamily)
MGPMETAEVFEELRPLLFSIAYRMLGGVSEAEDIVQDAFLRFHRAREEGAVVDSPKGYLTTTTTRLAIDQLRSARRRRERYVGTWLPEPLLTEAASDAAKHAETADSLSMAFLVLLESLSPVERAVFLLREVFGYDYAEIAGIVGKSEDNARQLASRARRHVDEHKPRFEVSRRQRDELARRFFAAVEGGDTEALVEMLAADVVLYGDGGGKAPAIPRPISGRERVARMLAAWIELGARAGVTLQPAEINGEPGARMVDRDGRLVSVWAIDIAENVVQTVRSIVNPDKLAHLGPVGDVRRLLRDARPQR